MSDTPRTDAAEAEYLRWLEYVRRNKPFAEAMEQAPKEADPFHIARELERELARALRVVEAARYVASKEDVSWTLQHEIEEWEAGR